MTVKVLLFGPHANVLGADHAVVDIEAAGEVVACGRLRSAMVQQYPALAGLMQGSRFAVNHAYVDDAAMIHEQDEVALIGMISGG
ncbi:MoaD/ThiS family protein [Poriferisphaera sp. WC338]|uniref:MoaD/ThiS family protein n=1 Tax=Poriferisphaera sp. WC338 TaxID=3425129 RepID=UPI003D819D01